MQATIEWKNGCVRLIEQTLLPEKFKVVNIKTVPAMWDAIKRLAVRGAPAIGIAAAYGAYLGIHKSKAKTWGAFKRELHKATKYLATSRPTAVNLFWALDRMEACAEMNKNKPVKDIIVALKDEADAIFTEDCKICRAIGKNGAKLVKKNSTLLTHCNAGGLATADYGTALAVMFAAQEKGKNIKVFADETRPLLQGARLTAWELMRAKIPVTLICDNMAAQVMKEGKIDMIVVGADRIAANGDAANKIGTYMLAVLAKYHKVPFYIAAPKSTFDFSLKNGDGIPIEERKADEITCGFGKRTAPRKCPVYNPAFDVTPAKLITGIITEYGVIEKPTTAKVKKHFA
jgi:methylthioribose-1-phosphate isomerase